MHTNEERPLRAWLARTETSATALAARVEEEGGTASAKYIEHVANENYEPSWHLCEVLEKVTGIDARVLKSRPYRRAPKHAKRATG